MASSLFLLRMDIDFISSRSESDTRCLTVRTRISASCSSIVASIFGDRSGIRTQSALSSGRYGGRLLTIGPSSSLVDLPSVRQNGSNLIPHLISEQQKRLTQSHTRVAPKVTNADIVAAVAACPWLKACRIFSLVLLALLYDGHREFTTPR